MSEVQLYSKEAEQAVLGGILARPQALEELEGALLPEDFYFPGHRRIFKACSWLKERGSAVDLITLKETLKKYNKLEEVGGEIYLAELLNRIVSSASITDHAEIVKEKSIRRGLLKAGQDLAAKSTKPEPLEEIVDEVEAQIMALADRGIQGSYYSAEQLLNSSINILERRTENEVAGINTGYLELNELTGGFQRQDLIIIAGRPSMGKTAFALNVAANVAIESGEPIVFFSLEMSKEQVMFRLFGALGKVNMAGMRRGRLREEDWGGVYKAAELLEEAPFFIDDTPALSVLEVRSRCRRVKAEHGLSLVVIDYLQLMQPSGRIDSREQQISDISRKLKSLAKELDVPVVALSQLNRKVEERGDKRPLMSDLRESGAIEQDADLIIFLFREAAYKKPEELTDADNTAEIIIGKQRNGPTGVVKLAFFKNYTKFENLYKEMQHPTSQTLYQ